jgi:hypothetical protein
MSSKRRLEANGSSKFGCTVSLLSGWFLANQFFAFSSEWDVFVFGVDHENAAGLCSAYALSKTVNHRRRDVEFFDIDTYWLAMQTSG